MLSIIRRSLASISLLAVTMLFLSISGIAHKYLAFMAEVQLIPALLAHSIIVVLVLLIITAIFGRVYCSLICPLGISQDIVARIGRRKKKLPYSHSKPKTILRLVSLTIVILSFAFGFPIVLSLLDPYAAFGRIASGVLLPIYKLGNNALAVFAEQLDSFAFYSVDVWVKSSLSLAVALITLFVIAFLAWRGGRTYCNTVCPVGTVLGLFSRKSVFRIIIDADKCNGCSMCASNCKSSCIDVDSKSIDASRCVSCFNCIDKCKRDAIKYQYSFGKSKHHAANNSSLDESNLSSVAESTNTATKATNTDLSASRSTSVKSAPDASRRAFLSSTAVISASVVSAQVLPKASKMKVDGGLAEILPKENPKRLFPIVPPGAISFKHLQNHCTACHLCVSACPNDVLRPSSNFESFLQPVMGFEHGYCRPECTRCSDVCPNNAITPVDAAEKSSIQIGIAMWVEERCIVVSKGDKCFNCARHCPTGAITMVQTSHAHPTPHVNPERCIGCGACENLCPSRPISAIFVNGNYVHRSI